MKTNICALCGGTRFHFMFRHHYGWSMQRCDACGLVAVMPRPSAAEIARLYHEDMEHFTPYIEQMPVHREFFRRKVREIIAHVIPAQAGIHIHEETQILAFARMTKRMGNDNKKRLLDVGCAMGILIKEAQKQGFRAEGVDISKDAVSYCKKHGYRVYQGTLNSRPGLERGGYDIITAFEVIEHEQDPLGMVKAAYKLLKKDGLFVIGTPDHAGWWRVIMGKHWFGYKHPEHIVLFDPTTITALLKKAGFTEIEVKRDTPRTFPLYFVFTRGADYFPWARLILVPIGNLIKRLHIVNPINPWDDMIVFARK